MSENSCISNVTIDHSKTNKWDATVDTLQVRKRIAHLTSENCERNKRNYTKSTNEYWSGYQNLFLPNDPKARKSFTHPLHF
jgi:conjugal transfer/entry exclusion protein